MQPRIAGPSWPKTTSKTRRAGGSSVAARGLAVAGTLRSPPLLGPSERTSRPAIFHFARGAACARPTLLVPRTRLRARSADAQAGQGPPARRKGEWPRQRARDAGASPGTPLQAWPSTIRGLGPSPHAVCRRCRAVTPPPSIIRALCLRCVFHAPAGRFPARLCRAQFKLDKFAQAAIILLGAFLQSLAQFGHVDRVLFASLGFHTTTRPAFISSLLAAMSLIVSASFRMSNVSTSLHVRGRAGAAPAGSAPSLPCAGSAPPEAPNFANDAKQLPRPTSSPACYNPYGLAVIVGVHRHCGCRESLCGMCSGQRLQMRAGGASQARFWHGLTGRAPARRALLRRPPRRPVRADRRELKQVLSAAK